MKRLSKIEFVLMVVVGVGIVKLFFYKIKKQKKKYKIINNKNVKIKMPNM